MSRSSGLGSRFHRLLGAATVANIGDGVVTVAAPWLASSITRDPILLSLVVVATRLPWLLFTLPAGVLTDRLDRRRIMVWMDLVRFGVLAALSSTIVVAGEQLSDPALVGDGAFVPPANQGAWLAVVYAAALVLGSAEVLRDNAAQTIMPRLVDADQLERANGRLWGAEMVANSFVGPPLGGLLIAVSLAVPFGVNAAAFLAASVLIASIPGRFGPATEPPTRRPSFWVELKEGVRWLWGHRLLRMLAVVLGVMNALLMLAFATMVLFVQEVLDLDAARFGMLLTAGAAGGVLGSLVASRVSGRLGPGPSLLATLIGSSLTLGITGLTSTWGVVWAMTAVGSLLAVLWNVITVSLRQSIIPDHLLGRVNSVYRWFAWGMMPVGSLLGGLVVVAIEPLAGREWALRAPFLLGAAVYAVLAATVGPRLTTERIANARAGAG